MTMLALHAAEDAAGVRRWTLSAAAVVAAHAALIGAGLAWYNQAPPPGTAMPAIMVDMAPSHAAPSAKSPDIAPGPEMQQAEAAEPPPPQLQPEPQPEQLPPTPPQHTAAVTAPPEPKPQAKPEPQAKPPEPAKPVKKPPRKQAEAAAPHTSAPPAADRVGRAAAATAGEQAAAALPSYRDRLAAHLQRYKRYPAEANGANGTAMLSFTVGRHGEVLRASLAHSSGSSALDAETLAMIRRAQPLPAFPPEMSQGSLSFTVPVRFSSAR
ncbi:energy transducer TonB [Rhodopseudomonas pseudopalustris]|uniref:energy transducer TonB family protein n=1 Tax=Rhodopseudomonas pseudopalustris TaxID=1513892 RepID=UPI003F9B5732